MRSNILIPSTYTDGTHSCRLSYQGKSIAEWNQLAQKEAKIIEKAKKNQEKFFASIANGSMTFTKLEQLVLQTKELLLDIPEGLVIPFHVKDEITGKPLSQLIVTSKYWGTRHFKQAKDIMEAFDKEIRHPHHEVRA